MMYCVIRMKNPQTFKIGFYGCLESHLAEIFLLLSDICFHVLMLLIRWVVVVVFNIGAMVISIAVLL